MFSYIVTFIYGFLSGLMCNYIMKLYNRFTQYNYDIRKTIVHQAYTYLSEQIFDIVVDDLVTNITTTDIQGIQNLADFKKLIDSIVYLTKDFNKKYTLNIVSGKIQLKLIDTKYINEPNFIFICKFFTDNNVDVHIVLNDNTILNNKLEYHNQ